VSGTIDQLIARLAGEAEPVRRLLPPLIRAALWLAAVAVVSAGAVAALADLDVIEQRTGGPILDLELVATLATGVLAIVAAFYLSLPDRPLSWALLPLPTLVIWIASSGYSCYRNWIVTGTDGWAWGDSAQCFRFIVLVSIPLGVALLFALRRARPIAPVPVAALGGLGVAALAAFLLQFFHPFDVTILDLTVHVVAVALVVGVSSLVGRLSTSQSQRP
jgi:hypothetical protein